MLDIDDLYRQEFALFSWYRAGKLTREQYLSNMKILDKAILVLEMDMFKNSSVLKKASLQHFQRREH